MTTQTFAALISPHDLFLSGLEQLEVIPQNASLKEIPEIFEKEMYKLAINLKLNQDDAPSKEIEIAEIKGIKSSVEVILNKYFELYSNLVQGQDPTVSEIFMSEINNFKEELINLYLLGFRKVVTISDTENVKQGIEQLNRHFFHDLHYLSFFALYTAFKLNDKELGEEILTNLDEISQALYRKLQSNHKKLAFAVPARAENPQEVIGIIDMGVYIDHKNSEDLEIFKKLASSVPPLVIAEFVHENGENFGLLVNVSVPNDLEESFQKIARLGNSVSDRIQSFRIIVSSLILNQKYRNRLFQDIFTEKDIQIIDKIITESDLRLLIRLTTQFMSLGLSKPAQNCLANLNAKTIIEKINNLIIENFNRTVKVFGLNEAACGAGATLPGSMMLNGQISNKVEKSQKITNGHRITILLMIESLKKALMRKFSIVNEIDLKKYLEGENIRGEKIKIGIIGGGYIGEACISTLLSIYPNIEFLVYEKNPQKAKKLKRKYGRQVKTMKSEDAVLLRCPVVLAAPRGKLNLTKDNYNGVIVISDSEPDCLPNDYRRRDIVAIKPLAVGAIDLIELKESMTNSLNKLPESAESEKNELKDMLDNLDKLIKKEVNKIVYHKEVLVEPSHEISREYNYGTIKGITEAELYINSDNFELDTKQRVNPGLLYNAMFGCELESVLVMILGEKFAKFSKVSGSDLDKLRRFGIWKVISKLVDVEYFQHNGVRTLIKPLAPVEI
ncbi:hypothetical protein D6810_03075 [Candidatus Dojkabacteria bacterium]|uniref:Pyrroline-5-carboxylate reductase catalytic N-terminal domain-containing protein n=1 Tax=Candidatus Dojkabacteria bacterium TaxID=2099670 RepID=A0A3M0YXE4_9BACT|nr:MAG: hypothetical protein D6810_03075 [Candidatus Dojkabacteria bacterium]